jgi:hypothetical protein
MEIGPAAVRSNEIQKRETWSAENAATLAALDLETVSAQLCPHQVPTGTNVVVGNVTTVQGEEMANEVGSLPMAVDVASGSGLSCIPMAATIVVLTTAENVSIFRFPLSFLDLFFGTTSSPRVFFYSSFLHSFH